MPSLSSSFSMRTSMIIADFNGFDIDEFISRDDTF